MNIRRKRQQFWTYNAKETRLLMRKRNQKNLRRTLTKETKEEIVIDMLEEKSNDEIKKIAPCKVCGIPGLGQAEQYCTLSVR